MTVAFARVREWLRARPVAADALLAAAVVVLQAALGRVTPADYRAPTWLAAAAWTLADAAPIVIRRRWLPVAGAVSLAISLAAIAFYPDFPGFGFLVIAYTAAAYLEFRRAVVASVVLWCPGMVVGIVLNRQQSATPNVPVWYYALLGLMLALVVFFVGRTVHNRRAYTAALEERARTAEENQRSLAAQSVADERRRIARELHDMVAHHVSVMGVLATGARRVLRRDPTAVDETLGTIEETARTALREMRRLLTVLRTEAEPDVELAPQPGLAGIESLLDQVRDAGLPVALRVNGDAAPLDPGVALAVYRIVQEALTNTIKHAGEATAEVRLDFGQLWLHLEIFDTGRGQRFDPARLGHGLLGMRERVALYGGFLRIGPRPGGGFRVYAKIPMNQETT